MPHIKLIQRQTRAVLFECDAPDVRAAIDKAINETNLHWDGVMRDVDFAVTPDEAATPAAGTDPAAAAPKS